MKRIAVLNDLSGMGKCSLTAAIPVLSVMGVQVCPLPTAVLSAQTGFPSYYCDDYTDRMDILMDEWQKMHFRPDGIYTGFLAGALQAEKAVDFIQRFKSTETKVLVDPVMGDDGEEYSVYTEELCEKMRILVQEAAVITPNVTEALLLLYGSRGMHTEWQKLADLSMEALLEYIQQTRKAAYRKISGRDGYHRHQSRKRRRTEMYQQSDLSEKQSDLDNNQKRRRQLFRNGRSVCFCTLCRYGQGERYRFISTEGGQFPCKRNP